MLGPLQIEGDLSAQPVLGAKPGAAWFPQPYIELTGEIHQDRVAALAPEQREALSQEILDLLRNANRGGSASLIVPGEYLEAVIITKAA